MFKQIFLNTKLHIGKRSQKTELLGKPIEEAKVHMGL